MRFFFYWYAIKPATPFTKMYSVFRCSNFNDIGGVVRVTKDKTIVDLFEFKSDEEPSLIDEINLYIKSASEGLK